MDVLRIVALLLSRVPVVIVTAILLLTAMAAAALGQAVEQRAGAGRSTLAGHMLVAAKETVPAPVGEGARIEIVGELGPRHVHSPCCVLAPQRVVLWQAAVYESRS